MRRAIVIGPFFGTGQRNHNIEAFKRAQLALRESASTFANIPHSSVPAGMPEPDQMRAMARHLLVHDSAIVLDGIVRGSFEEALVTLARGIGMDVVPIGELLPGQCATAAEEPASAGEAETTAHRLASGPVVTGRKGVERPSEQERRRRGSAAGAEGRRRPVLVDGKRFGSVSEAAKACSGSCAGLVNALKRGGRFKGHEVAYDD